MRNEIIAVLFALLLSFTLCPSAVATVEVEVHAGGHDRQNCPVTVVIPESLLQAKRLRLVRRTDSQEIPVQRFGASTSPRITWMIQDRLDAGKKRIYTLSAATAARVKPNVTSMDDGARLSVSVRGAPVLHFNHQPVEPPDGVAAIYRRSGYIHPLLTPQGNTVTGDFEPDHPHQHGVFFAWVKATFQGRPVDFWNQAKGTGDISFQEFKYRRRNGPVFSQFTARLEHVAIHDGQRIPAIDELVQVKVYDSVSPFLVEIISRQQPSEQHPLVVQEYHYGGFALRGPSNWLTKSIPSPAGDDPHAASGFVTSSGRSREDGNHTRARWVEMHGPVGQQHAGIIVLGAPKNFRAPQTVRLHPTKPYFCFAPMVLGEFVLAPEEVYTSRYRLVIHDGAADPELAERMWQDLAHPPKVILSVP